ncbi:MAG: helix-turn-helix transcriptional regulator [Hyphomicrobiales bacterium]|nr:helix-turn-helix transcriptional regulator [Hyphomicrobiales bacterium]
MSERAMAEHALHDSFVAELGRLLRLARAKRGMTRRQLAEESGASERYLAQIESGQGNPSVVILRSIAQALEIPVVALLPGESDDATMARIIDLVARLSRAELADVAALLTQRVGHGPANARARRIALVGLRGAGKSTLGLALAQAMECPFVELVRLVEQDYGARSVDLIEMAGITTFRRYERACLERVIAEHETAVIATAGGIVSNAETYALLLRRSHAIWLKARPEEHMQRVMEQGDFRPMAQNREAMSDLVAILEARRNDYARAEAELDTAGDTVERSLAKLVALVRRFTGEPASSAHEDARAAERAHEGARLSP